MYDPATGRFQTKDSWQGDYNRPLSLNRWNYVHSNPVNYLDPTGKRPVCVFWAGWNQASIEKRVDYAEKIVSPNSSDEINTYVAAAIAIQCAGRDEWRNKNSGIGSAQITQNQATTKYGEAIPERNWRGDIIARPPAATKTRRWPVRCEKMKADVTPQWAPLEEPAGSNANHSLTDRP
jgi:hypothetical protein